MLNLLRLVLIVACLFSLGEQYAEAQNSLQYAIRDVTLIPLDRTGSIPHQTVLIENGLITKIGHSARTKIPRSFTTIDGRDKYLMPGLMDMHAHFFQEQGEHTNTNAEELKLMLANGLTTVRIMAGHPDYLDARTKVRSKEWLGPDLFVASPQLVGSWPWPAEFKNYEVVDTHEKAVAAVKRFKAEGYDAIKLTFMLSREVFNAVVHTAYEIGMKVTGHVGPEVKLPRALKAGMQIEHMDEFIDMLLPDTSYNHGQSVSDMNIWRPTAWATVPFLDEDKIPELARKVRDAHVYVTPTNHFFLSSFGKGMSDEEIKNSPDFAYIPIHIRTERWRVRQHYANMLPSVEHREKYVRVREAMTYALWKSGVKLMAGSDSPEWFLVQGFSLHKELEAFTQAGLPPYAALQTATINPAEYLGISQRKGTVEVGKDADLLLLEANPLEDVANAQRINGVFKGGKWLDRGMLDRLLEEAKSIGE